MNELRTIARHAGTVYVGQAAVLAFGITDTLVASRYSGKALAALGVGSAVYITIFVGLMGMLQAQLPKWAELRGAGRPLELGRSVRQCLYLGMAACAAGGVALLLSPEAFLRWTEVPQELRGEVSHYLAIAAVSLPPALLFRLYSTLSQSLGRPRLVTWIQVGALVLKVPLSIWLAFGGLGLPAMGLAGCAWASVVVFTLMVAIALWTLRTQDVFTPYRIWAPMERIDWSAQRGFARLGIPTALSIVVEVTSFTLMALFVARQGIIATAGHQVASSMAGLLYMMPLSLGIASSARVSYWIGAGDMRHARLALRLGLKLSLGLALACAIAVAALHQPLARLYVGDNPPVVAMAAGLLVIVAAYHLFDAVQCVCVFLLRCFGVATAPVVVYSVLLWGLGLGGGYALAYQGVAGWAPTGTPAAFWLAATLALAVTAVAFVGLLWRAVRARAAA